MTAAEVWLSVPAAARIARVHPKSVGDAVREGRVLGRRDPRVGLLVARSSVEAYAAKVAATRAAAEAHADRVRDTKTERRCVPAEPLLEIIDARGGPGACGVRDGSRFEAALRRARRSGWMTPAAADQLAVAVLGLVPWEVWGDAVLA